MIDFIIMALPFIALAVTIVLIINDMRIKVRKKDASNNENADEKETSADDNNLATGLSLGLCLGVAIGTALMKFFGKMAITYGICFGMLGGILIKMYVKKKK